MAGEEAAVGAVGSRNLSFPVNISGRYWMESCADGSEVHLMPAVITWVGRTKSMAPSGILESWLLHMGRLRLCPGVILLSQCAGLLWLPGPVAALEQISRA